MNKSSIGNYFTYIPNVNFTGTDTFIYGLCNDEGEVFYATVTIFVGSTPCLEFYKSCTYKNSPYGLPISLLDIGCSPDACEQYEIVNLNESINESAGDGSIKVIQFPICEFEYFPPNDFVGTKTFTIEYCEQGVNPNCYSVNLEIEVNDWPEIERCVAPGDILELKFSDFIRKCYDFIPNTNIGEINVNSGASINIYQNSPEGYFTYQAPPNFTGIDEIIVGFSLNSKLSVAITIRVDVNPHCQPYCPDELISDNTSCTEDGITFYKKCYADDCGYYLHDLPSSECDEQVYACAGEMVILGESIESDCPDNFYYGWDLGPLSDTPEFYTDQPWYALTLGIDLTPVTVRMYVYNQEGVRIGEKLFDIHLTYEVPDFKLQDYGNSSSM